MLSQQSLIFSGAVLAAFATMTSTAQAATVTIDSFETPQFLFSGESGAVQGSGILGGEREVTYTSEGAGSFGENLQIGNGSLVLSSAFELVEADLLWNGVGDVGLGGVDLTDEGTESGLSIDIFGIGTLIATPELALTFSIVDSSGNESSLAQFFETQFLFDNASNSSPVTALFSFDAFVGSADVTDVDSIGLNIVGPLALDASFGTVTTTPVPEPLTIVGSLTALGLGGVMKRKLAKQSQA